jgi:hypothetical protein
VVSRHLLDALHCFCFVSIVVSMLNLTSERMLLCSLLGGDEVKTTKNKNGSTCYKVDSMISGIWEAEDDSACNV